MNVYTLVQIIPPLNQYLFRFDFLYFSDPVIVRPVFTLHEWRKKRSTFGSRLFKCSKYLWHAKGKGGSVWNSNCIMHYNAFYENLSYFINTKNVLIMKRLSNQDTCFIVSCNSPPPWVCSITKIIQKKQHFSPLSPRLIIFFKLWNQNKSQSKFVMEAHFTHKCKKVTCSPFSLEHWHINAYRFFWNSKRFY